MVRSMRIFLVLCAVFVAGSCSFPKSVYDSVSRSTATLYDSVLSDTPLLKKRVLVLPFNNQAGLEPGKVEELTSTFISEFNKDNYYLIQRGSVVPTQRGKPRYPESGIVADSDQAKKAADMGMNVMVTVLLSPHDMRTRTKGFIWPFKRVVADVEISMIMNAYDVVNGTLFATNIESVKMETEVDEFDQFQKEQPGKMHYQLDPEKVEKAWDTIVDRQAYALNKALAPWPWMGRILSVGSNGAVINAGSDVGVKPGVVFEVLGRAEIIQSAAGQPIALMGPRIAELKVTETQGQIALATSPPDKKVEPGQIIRVKR
jgi:hypothetical protein